MRELVYVLIPWLSGCFRVAVLPNLGILARGNHGFRLSLFNGFIAVAAVKGKRQDCDSGVHNQRIMRVVRQMLTMLFQDLVRSLQYRCNKVDRKFIKLCRLQSKK